MIYQFVCGNYKDGTSGTMIILAEGPDLWSARSAVKEWIETSGRLGWWIQSARPEPVEPELTIWRDESGVEYCLDDDGVWQLDGSQWVQTHLTEANWCAFVKAGVITPC